MNNQSLTGLMDLGLTEKEAVLYLAALKLGPTTAQNLALESDLKRATVYPYIDSLIAKGLFHVQIQGVRKLFIPESPDKLVGLLERKKQVLANIMPLLVQDFVQTSPANNVIKMYYGLTGIKLIYDDLLTHLNPGDDYLVLSDQEKWHALDPEYFEEFLLKRSQLDLRIKLILQSSEHARTYQQKENFYKENIKLIPKNLNLNINMVILPTKVLLVQTVDPLLAILIENPNIAAMNRALFNFIWEIL